MGDLKQQCSDTFFGPWLLDTVIVYKLRQH